ncbi:hypothetical protein NODU109028_02880 [Nocardioides dubius]
MLGVKEFAPHEAKHAQPIPASHAFRHRNRTR